MKERHVLRLTAILMLGLLTACAGGRGPSPAKSPRSSETGGYYKVGKPYQIKGNWYYPEENFTYDETGLASWYGADFHELQTANGETYNKNELTAAHPTLPMPSLARVTNLENGRAVVVRINDRGPYSGARLIDVSQRAAQLLGFEKKGTAKVRVQVLADESRAIAEAMQSYGNDPSAQMQAQAQTRVAGSVAEASFSPATPPRVEMRQLEPPIVAPVSAAPSPKPLTVADVHPVAEYTQVPVTGRNDLFVQAGAFTMAENAKRLKNTLSKYGHASIAEADVKGVHYYRVRLGPIKSVPDADKLLGKIRSAGADGARIVVD